MLGERGRFLFVFGALLLVLANVALGDGIYQRTKDGKTFVWNNHPKPGDEAIWSGSRDREGYARGFGTLIWYTSEQQGETGSAKRALYARYWGNMVQGKLNGPVNVHSKKKTDHATFAAGVRTTRWAAGPAPSRAGAQPRPMVQTSEDRGQVSEISGPAAAGKLQSEISARPFAQAAEPEAPGEGPLNPTAAGKLRSEVRGQGSEGNTQFSANASVARTDVDEALLLLAWPPRSLGMRSISKGSLAVATRAHARLSQEQVVDLADAAARSRGYDPTEYQRQGLQYDPSDQAWSLVYDERSPDGIGENPKHLSIAVGDKTKRTALVLGR